MGQSQGLLNGKVAVITGAGGGLGRAHALAMAKEGAKIVVNDLGGSRDGVGNSSSMASQVVEEIKRAGGEAVANFDSVADAAGAEKIVRTAVEAFGRLDIFVNNAGILRDKTLLKMDDKMWKLVMAVHLDGTFYCGRAAARYMSENKIAGTIINTTSYSGLKGNYGQCNYGAAKAGIGALTKIWALELAKHGITVNAIAPMAKTRMTEDIDAVPEDVKPEQISPMVVFLASELAKEVNGRIFGVHGRHIFEYKTELTEGVKRETDWVPSEIASQLPAISASKSENSAPAASPKVSAVSDNSLGGRIKRAFDLMPVAFTPEKAGGWNSVIQFLIEGADSYTLTIQDKKCTVQQGVHGAPTCKVNVSADTMASMIEGKVSGQQAFMSGKIKSSSLGDMMKFGKVFDFKRAREAASQSATQNAATTAAAAAPNAQLETVFQRLPEVFLPDQVSGWNGKVVVDVAGTEGWTASIENRQCKIEKGKLAGAICTLVTTAENFARVLSDKLDLNAASTQGLLKASNPMALIKFNRAFDWKSPKLSQSSSGAEAQASSSGGINPSVVGRKYRGPAIFVRPENIELFAEATNDPNSRFKSPKENWIAPPVFPVTLVSDVFREMLGDDIGVDLSRMVHGEQSIQFFHPLKPWDLISPRGVITGIEKKGSGEVLHFDQLLYREGELATKITTSLFIRGEKRVEQKPDGVSAEKPAPTGEPVFTHQVTVSEDQPRRYAAASGDNNPIHLDPQVAQAAGFPGVILHGLCTMAFTGQAIVEKVLGGDLSRLKELSVRFSKPVFPGDTLTISGYRNGEGSIQFTVTNQNRVAVITNGVARHLSAVSTATGLTSSRHDLPPDGADQAYSVS